MMQPESRKEVNKAPQISKPQSISAERDPRDQFGLFPSKYMCGEAEEGAINIFQKEGRKKIS